MDKADLKIKLIEGCDSLLKHTWVLSNEQLRIIRGQKRLWETNDAALDALLVIVNQTAEEKGDAKAITIDWSKLFELMQKFPAVLMLIQQIINIFVPAPTPIPPLKLTAKEALTAGCCDHHACCTEVLCSALQTAAKAADHLCQCECDQ